MGRDALLLPCAAGTVVEAAEVGSLLLVETEVRCPSLKMAEAPCSSVPVAQICLGLVEHHAQTEPEGYFQDQSTRQKGSLPRRH